MTARRRRLVASIGVRPGNFARRAALRRTWLRWLGEAADTEYVFFTEIPQPGSRGYNASLAPLLRAEAEEHGDMFFQEGPAGYGKENGRRELLHLQHFLSRRRFRFYLRVDDDGFLCVRQLLEELRWHHKPPLLHGRYHCHDAKARMDENYLLMSHDVASVVTAGFATGQLPFAPKLTFALSLGFLVPVLQSAMGLNVFDDGDRFVWPYPGERAREMGKKLWYGEHPKKPGPFCDKFIWSHWVKAPEDIDAMYALQMDNPDSDTARFGSARGGGGEPSERVRRALELASRNVCGRYRGFEDGVPPYRNPAGVVGPGHGIPGSRPFANDTAYRDEVAANITRLAAEYRAKGRLDTGGTPAASS